MIKIYGTSGCAYCKKAVEVAEQYTLEYEYIDAIDNAEEFASKFPEAKTVPQITWADRHVGGFSEFALEIENTVGGYGDGKI